MKKYLLLCLVSALGGVMLAGFWRPERTTAPLPVAAESASAAEPAPAIPAPPPRTRGGAVAAGRAGLPDHLTPEERVNVIVYENVNRSVVNINTRSVRPDRFMLFEVPQEGAGSGSVLDKRGHILTNFHVIEDAREIQVTLFDGNTYAATPVGIDPNTDIAVIKIDAPAASLFPVQFGESSQLRVGQRVLAIGNPFGLERTLTVGIVSSLNRTIRSRNNRQITSIVQTDAAINPGNSGGPLLDSRGLLIGITTAIASRTGQNSGVGFAIPVSIVRRIVPQLIADGRVIRAQIGISRVLETDSGLIIAGLVSGGPAEKAGLLGFRLVRERRRQGPFVYERTTIDRSTADRIVAVDRRPVTSADDFLQRIESHKPGEIVIVTVVRQGRRTDVRVTLSAGE